MERQPVLASTRFDTFPPFDIVRCTCFYWMSSETSINNQDVEFCHSVITRRCSCWFNWIDSRAWNYSFSGKQMERTYWLEPQFVYFHSHSAALIHSCHKSHHKGSNGAYDGSFQLPRPFAGIEGTNGQYSPRQSGKLTLMDSRPSFGRSKDAASFTLPSLFSFPLARKEDEEA